MAYKVILTSNNPSYIDFNTWIQGKLSQAQNENNTAEIQKIQYALSAKEAANTGQDNGSETTTVADNVTTETNIRPELSIPVPAFDEYWNQWAAEFGVTVTIETVE